MVFTIDYEDTSGNAGKTWKTEKLLVDDFSNSSRYSSGKNALDFPFIETLTDTLTGGFLQMQWCVSVWIWCWSSLCILSKHRAPGVGLLIQCLLMRSRCRVCPPPRFKL